jgi:ferritin-like metal-binding protein YciE
MSNSESKNRPTGGMQLDSEKLKSFFVKHLNIIYAIKANLVRRLPELSTEVYFKDLYLAMHECINDIPRQMARMEVIFELLDASISGEIVSCNTKLVDDAFVSIKDYSGEPELQDLSILFYLQNIENIEMGSFQMLQMAAVKLKNPHIQQLVKENFDEAKDDRTMMLLIASKYLTAK